MDLHARRSQTYAALACSQPVIFSLPPTLTPHVHTTSKSLLGSAALAAAIKSGSAMALAAWREPFRPGREFRSLERLEILREFRGPQNA